MKERKKEHGFTIVELLIIIVVIAILAAISIVAYNGIQNRAHDSAVQGDLRQISTLIRSHDINEGRVPTRVVFVNGTFASMNDGEYDFTVSKDAYRTDLRHSLLYCMTSSPSEFALYAASRSGTFYEATANGVREHDGWAGSRWANSICADNSWPNADGNLFNRDASPQWREWL